MKGLATTMTFRDEKQRSDFDILLAKQQVGVAETLSALVDVYLETQDVQKKVKQKIYGLGGTKRKG